MNYWIKANIPNDVSFLKKLDFEVSCFFFNAESSVANSVGHSAEIAKNRGEKSHQ